MPDSKITHVKNLVRLLKDVIPTNEDESLRIEDGYTVVLEDGVGDTTVKIPEAEIGFNFCKESGRLRYIYNWKE